MYSLFSCSIEVFLDYCFFPILLAIFPPLFVWRKFIINSKTSCVSVALVKYISNNFLWQDDDFPLSKMVHGWTPVNYWLLTGRQPFANNFGHLDCWLCRYVGCWLNFFLFLINKFSFLDLSSWLRVCETFFGFSRVCNSCAHYKTESWSSNSSCLSNTLLFWPISSNLFWSTLFRLIDTQICNKFPHTLNEIVKCNFD